MVVIETDLKYIEEMAEEKAQENWRFRTFLKQLDMDTEELDTLVHLITDEVSSQIDCTKCANCCKQITPALDKGDISEFASGLKMPVPEFKEQYLTESEDTSSRHQFNALPCPFLKDNLCSNYECRPRDCVSYPHIHKEDFVSRLWGVVDNYAICPIVFNVYEWLKAELWHYDGLDEDFFDDIWM